jgi:ABC-type antimicrobial peptide transport system permease subunit
MYRQLQFINEQNASYNKAQLLSFSIPPKVLFGKFDDDQRIRVTTLLKNELLAASNIEDVSLINQQSVVDMKGASSGESNDWDGRDKDFMPFIAFIKADTNFKNIINLQITEGRWYEAGNTADEHNSILNETAVREFNILKPVIGQRFTSQGDTGVIIGVIKDFYYKSLHEKIGPVVIRADNEYSNTYIVKMAPGKIKEAQYAVEQVWKKFFPAEPFSYSFLNDEFDKLYHADRKTSSLIWIFSAIAIFISSLGLFGLAAFTAERRNKEIGIRKILGATVTNIVSLLSKEFIYMVLISILVAFPIAWMAMNKWLENFAYRINIAWWIFLTAAVIALAIAIITVSFQAIKAALTSPAKSLKTE